MVETFPRAVLTLAYRELAGLGLTEEERTLVVGFAVVHRRVGGGIMSSERWLEVR